MIKFKTYTLDTTLTKIDYKNNFGEQADKFINYIIDKLSEHTKDLHITLLTNDFKNVEFIIHISDKDKLFNENCQIKVDIIANLNHESFTKDDYQDKLSKDKLLNDKLHAEVAYYIDTINANMIDIVFPSNIDFNFQDGNIWIKLDDSDSVELQSFLIYNPKYL